MTTTEIEEQVLGKRSLGSAKQPLVLRVTDSDFQREVLEKLAKLEAQMETLVGSYQPGRMKLAEDRLQILERSEVRRSVYDRIVNAVIAVAISAAIAMHDHLGIR
ncbi:MAG TPA: hypothetical protein VJQ82_11910 [Terriglobales bacterium]|nr:hypothetical protein [Terriglobales bacterium]